MHVFEGIRVKVTNRYTLRCDRKILDLPMHLNNFEVNAYFYVLNMGDVDMVLWMTWLHDIDCFLMPIDEE